MTQFLLSILGEASPSLTESISQNIAPRDVVQLHDNVWLIAFDGSAKDLAERLGIEDGSSGQYLIASMKGVNGFVPQTVIQWIDEHDRRQ